MSEVLIIIIIIFLLVMFFDLKNSNYKNKNKYANKTPQEVDELLKSKWEKEEQEKRERKVKEEKYIKDKLAECRKDPNINIAIFNDEAWKVHLERLEKFGYSMYSGEMQYMGKRGGIYTVSANGTRNYKY